MLPDFTIGIEEKYQTVDPSLATCALTYTRKSWKKARRLCKKRVKPEMHQSVVEVVTAVCNNIKDCEVKKLCPDVIALAKGQRSAACDRRHTSLCRLARAGDYPRCAHKNIVEDLQLAARANLIFGLHVHIGVEDRESAVHLVNHARYFLPDFLACQRTRQEHRVKVVSLQVFDKFPRANIPD